MLAFLNEIIFVGHSPLSEAHLVLVHTALQELVLPSSSSKRNKTSSLWSISSSHVCMLHIPHTLDSPHCTRILRFSQHWEWYISSSVKRRYVTGYFVPDVSIQSNGLIFKSRKVHEEKGLKVLKPRPFEYETTRDSRNVGNQTHKRHSVKTQNNLCLNL